MEPTRALRLVAIVAALLTLAGGWPAPEAAAQPARLVAAQPPTGPRRRPAARTRARAARSAPPAAARARAAAAEQQARAAAAEARRVAQLAAARQRVRATWESRARPARLVIVRDVSLDIVTQGRLTRRTPRRAGPLNLTTLSRYLPRSWLSIDGGTATLSAAVVLTPRVVLDVGGDVTTVKLTGGATLSQAASIYTGSGRILLHGVTITSADPATGAAARRRPRPAVRRGDLRRPARRLRRDGHRPGHVGRRAQAPPRRPVQRRQHRHRGPLHLHAQQHRAAARRIAGRPHRGRRRHRVAGPRPVHLPGQRHGTAPGSAPSATPATASASTPRPPKEPITGVSTAGNGRFGLAAIRLRDTRIEDMRTNGDTAGGLELSQSAGVTVSGFTATDEPVGVYAHIGSTNITLERLAVTGGRRGVAVEKTTRNLVLQASTFDNVKLAGVAVGGSAVELRDVAVTDSQTGVRIERGADGGHRHGPAAARRPGRGGRDARHTHGGAERPVGGRRGERRGAHVQPGHPHRRRRRSSARPAASPPARRPRSRACR